MKKVITSLLLGASLLMAGYANAYNDKEMDDHHKPKSGHHHGEKSGHHSVPDHASKAPSGHHQNMSEHEGHSMGSKAGVPGKDSDVSRTINVVADDSMRFTHEAFDIKAGETIKFVVSNKGKIAHEFSIATKNEHMEHGKMMMDNPTMHHAPGGNVITIKSGETQTLIWTFKDADQVEAACNIPGHYQAGMHSPVNVLN